MKIEQQQLFPGWVVLSPARQAKVLIQEKAVPPDSVTLPV